jgi:hypothetical protein
MLYRLSPATPSREIIGRRLGKLTPTQAALLALDLERGGSCVHHFGRRQATKFARANQRDVATLWRATTDELERVKRGELALSALRNKPPSEVDRVVAKGGSGVSIPARPSIIRERALADLVCGLEEAIHLLDTAQTLADADTRIGAERFDDAFGVLDAATHVLDELRLAQD